MIINYMSTNNYLVPIASQISISHFLKYIILNIGVYVKVRHHHIKFGQCINNQVYLIHNHPVNNNLIIIMNNHILDQHKVKILKKNSNIYFKSIKS